jgi:hypothetical protein
MENKEVLELVQGNMLFLAAIGHAGEDLVGRGAASITFRAGRATGLKRKVEKKEPTDLLKAISVVREEIYRAGLDWDMEPYKKKDERDFISEDEENYRLKLVFKSCLVRSCQFIYGHPQKTSLCLVNHGLFCGLLQQVHGAFSDYEFIHSGENACIGLVKVRKRK